MSLDDIKTYDELDNLLSDIDYETLSDEDIERLCNKVWEICKREKAEIEKTEKNVDIGVISLMSADMEAAARCNKLRNCTEKRVLANIHKELDNFDKHGTRNPSDQALMSEHEKGLERLLD